MLEDVPEVCELDPEETPQTPGHYSEQDTVMTQLSCNFSEQDTLLTKLTEKLSEQTDKSSSQMPGPFIDPETLSKKKVGPLSLIHETPDADSDLIKFTPDKEKYQSGKPNLRKDSSGTPVLKPCLTNKQRTTSFGSGRGSVGISAGVTEGPKRQFVINRVNSKSLLPTG